MKKLKNLALGLSIGALTTTFPYITYSAQALPIIDVKEKELSVPLNIFNIENKNTKRNQKEEMAELLVSLYNKYNFIFKKGLEINDVKNSSLYFNISKQKSEIKNLINEIVNYPYSVVNSKIEQKFLKSNVLFCYLTNQYIQGESLENILSGKDIEQIKYELKNICEIVNYSIIAIENSQGNYSNIELNEKVLLFNNIVNEIDDEDSLKENFYSLKTTLNEVQEEINSVLTDYIHI